MKTRFGIAVLAFMMIQGVLFGIGVVLVLATPLKDAAMQLMPLVAAASFVIAIPLAWWLAPRLRARYWQSRPERDSVADKALAALS